MRNIPLSLLVFCLPFGTLIVFIILQNELGMFFSCLWFINNLAVFYLTTFDVEKKIMEKLGCETWKKYSVD
jgi:hypothetical protein